MYQNTIRVTNFRRTRAVRKYFHNEENSVSIAAFFDLADTSVPTYTVRTIDQEFSPVKYFSSEIFAWFHFRRYDHLHCLFVEDNISQV